MTFLSDAGGHLDLGIYLEWPYNSEFKLDFQCNIVNGRGRVSIVDDLVAGEAHVPNQ